MTLVRYHPYAWQTASTYILIAGFLIVIGLMIVYGVHPAGIAGMVTAFSGFLSRMGTFFPKQPDTDEAPQVAAGSDPFPNPDFPK
jgi:hypothetical protein